MDMRSQPKTPAKTISRDIALGLGIIIALSSFVIGNRWGDINRQLFGDQVTVNETLPQDLDYTEVEHVYDLLRANYDGELSSEAILDGIKEGLAEASGDPYTVYLNEEESKRFKDDLNGTFTGIGAELSTQDERLIVVAPLRGFPAEAAGLKPQDIISGINGENAFGLKVEEAVEKIRGPEGTDVTLSIVRNSEQFDVTITRQKIVVPSVESEIVNGIGIITISRFAEDTVDLARQAAADFRAQNVSGVVLDLRNNTGGYLTGAVEISGLWLDGDLVVETKRGDQVTERSFAPKGKAVLKGIPTAVLINEGSASASEIVAGALKDHGVATIVGQTSFGKGSVQELKTVKSGGMLKVTIARWYTPSGSNIDETGIEPDKEIEITSKDLEAERDPQLEAAKSLF